MKKRRRMQLCFPVGPSKLLEGKTKSEVAYLLSELFINVYKYQQSKKKEGTHGQN